MTTEFIADWVQQTWNLVLQAAPWLLLGFLLAGVVYVLVPVDKVTRHLGRPGLAGVVKASLFGIPLPLCSCSVIPVASSIRKQGASKGAFVSFLISTPETGIDSIAISYALLGPLWAIVRPVAAFVTALTAGALVDRIDPASASTRGHARENPGGNGACAESRACADRPPTIAGRRITAALRYGLVDMIADLSPWLVGGFLLAGLATAAIPDGFLQSYVGTGLSAMLVMLIVGLPLYVCSTSSTPIAAALIARGLSPGAALVFLLVGPATNIVTMVVVSRDVGRRGLAIYLLTIAVVAVAFGLLIDLTWPSLPVSLATIPVCGDHSASTAGWPIAAVLILLTLNGLRLRISRVRPADR